MHINKHTFCLTADIFNKNINNVNELNELEDVIDNYIRSDVVISRPYSKEELDKAVKTFNIVKIMYPYDYFTDVMLNSLTKLKVLTTNNNITDKGIKDLKLLEELYCDKNTVMSDYGLKHLHNLRILHCDNNTNFTDAGLEHLVNLIELYCDKNLNFTDEVFGKLTNLRYIEVSNENNFSELAIQKVLSKSDIEDFD